MPPYLGEPNFQQAFDERLRHANGILDQALEVVGEIQGELKTEILEGPPAEAILNVAEVRGNDLIIMGTRGLSRLAGLLIGSQSQKVIMHASCPVLLVR
jgi:nucleotide-binding universal stress UspA family protein